MHKPPHARQFCRFNYIARSQMVYTFEGICALFDDDSHQMNHGLATLHSLVQACACHNIARDQLHSVLNQIGGLRRIVRQRAHAMPFIEQSLKHISPDKAGAAGKEDLHGPILNVFLEIPNAVVFAAERSLSSENLWRSEE